MELIFRLRGAKARTLVERQYEYYREWYHLGLRELLNFYPFSGDHKALGRMLRPAIPAGEARRALNLLLEIGLVEADAQGSKAWIDWRKPIRTGISLSPICPPSVYRLRPVSAARGQAYRELAPVQVNADVTSRVGTLPLASFDLEDYSAWASSRDIRVDAAACLAEIWVKLDTVWADGRPQTLTLHWGNPGEPDFSGGAYVFGTLGGVWHLDGRALDPTVTAYASASPAAAQGEGIGDGRPAGKGGIAAGMDLRDGRWHHVAATWDGTPCAYTWTGRLGAENPSSHDFFGVMDEVGVSGEAWPADRVRLDYESQKPGSSLLSFP